MRTIIAGGREFDNYLLLESEVDFVRMLISSEITVVSGGARGADTLGERYAAERGLEVRRFPANWDKHGRSAGYIRNAEMADYADCLVAFWDGKSRGTKHMIDLALARGLLVKVAQYDG